MNDNTIETQVSDDMEINAFASARGLELNGDGEASHEITEEVEVFVTDDTADHRVTEDIN